MAAVFVGGAATPPAIVSGAIVTPAVSVQTPPATPALRFSFTTGPAGYDNASFTFSSPSGRQSIVLVNYSSTAPTSGTVNRVQDPVVEHQYAEPGTYTLQQAVITDAAGNSTAYDSAQLASLFAPASFTLANHAHPDTTLPTVTAGAIATPTVSLAAASPVFVANLTVSDTISGVASAIVRVADPNGRQLPAGAYAPAPIVKSALLPAGLSFAYRGAVATGTWSIVEVDVTDQAGNTLTVNDPAAVKTLFGGAVTFQVTN